GTLGVPAGIRSTAHQTEGCGHGGNAVRARRAPRVKICCIGSVEEAALAIECGASALGLVSNMPSGPGVIGDERIAEIAATVPPAIGTFLLTSRQRGADLIEQHRFCR